MYDDDVDFAEVYADDWYLDQLGGLPVPNPLDALGALLMSWRYTVDAEPIDVLVALDMAAAEVRASRRRQGRA